jgi:3-methyladenine DNA glycosylase/8-oxoguanine DNA glycosylase
MAIYKRYLDKRAAKKRTEKSGKLKGDKGARKKTASAKIKLPTPEQMEKIAKSWEPYRSVACWYLWQSLDLKTIG